MSIGAMRRRVAIQTVAKSPGTSGAQTRVYSTVSTVWCRLEPVGSGTSYIGTVNGDDGGATHRLTMRAGTAITKDRYLLVDGLRRFRVAAIRSVDDDRAKGGFVEVLCSEERS